MTLLPPKLSDLRAGHKLVAGNRESTIIADLDFETYSPAGYEWDAQRQRWTGKGLIDVGAAKYSEHPDAEVLSMAYDLKDGGGADVWVPKLHTLPLELFEHINNGGLIEAWNVTFERWIWENICVRKYGFPQVHPSQWRDAMAKSRAHALPGRLAEAGEVLRISKPKDPRGKKLIQMFCVPRNPTKTDGRLRLRPHLEGASGVELYEYNIRDIEAEAEISSLIPDLLPQELEFWQCDQAINHRGVQIDVELMHKCISIIEQAEIKYNNELRILTNGEVNSASEVGKLMKWCQCNAPKAIIDSLSKGDILDLLAVDWVPDHVKQALLIRQSIGSAAVKKLYAMCDQVTKNGRLHDLFIYHSARTGRAAGQGPQPQNLPNGGPNTILCRSCSKHFIDREEYSVCPYCDYLKNYKYKETIKEWSYEAVENALEIIKIGDVNTLEYYFTDAMATVSGCLRSLFIAAPNKDLICSDYHSIEAVVLAALAGEEWRLEVFRTHGKIYELSASKVTGIPFEEFELHLATTKTHHPKRKLGKVAELASGFQGWTAAWKRFGADEFMSEEEIKNAANAWRKASPKIVSMWHELECCAINAIQDPLHRKWIPEHNDLEFQFINNILYIKLLSGRYLTYHQPELQYDHERNKMSLSYMGWNSNINHGAIGWTRIRTYGGKLTENVVQATARDILAHAIVNLENRGYPVVLHIHDEIVCEVKGAPFDVQDMEEIMNEMPEWCKNWPIKAKGGWRGKRYRK